MLGEEYTLEYLPLFDAELAEAVHYITQKLRNPDAANKLIDDVEQAITDRLFAPESFEFLILQSGIIEVQKAVLEETWNHADSTMCHINTAITRKG